MMRVLLVDDERLARAAQRLQGPGNAEVAA
jgi:hypothetical protein